MADPATVLASTTPNSKPRQQTPKALQTYLYQDFANTEPSALNAGSFHERVPPQSLQSQKLPSKLAAMLSDPDHASIITWMPHGRSWKILNRELFSTFALPRYFGHSNHASFVRIVNAWGFRRITKGPDRDSYYHEMFLRGKPRLHERMKRLPTCHRKTPVDKEDKCPDFYDLAKTSPLPEVSWSFQGSAGVGSLANVAARTDVMNQLNAMNQASAAGYGNPMAANSFGMGNHTDIYGNVNAGASSSAAMESYLSNTTNQGNDVSSLLKLLRQQGQPQQQQQQQQQEQQQQESSANAMNQNLMHQLLRLQQQQRNTPPNQPSNTAGSTLGQLASVASFAQPPATTSPPSNNAMLNSLTNSMNSVAPHQQQRRLSNDKISVNDVMQLRTIERTNELLAQKLALMQQDTMTMKQNSSDGAPTGQLLPTNTEAGSAPSVGGGNTNNNNPSNEEMLLQMIRCESQRNGASLANTTNIIPTKLEDSAGNMSQGLNHFLRSLNGMQQQPTSNI
eukprot:CAMPEP_0172299608 /NCGR_PEP_ID=MMETSP1058-20130122/1877_1 /TAXON_ID=83371 /ORGANISM="Detonula confervacea, Strain CCMP 353" /LENGTH=506 /DNA_ID=CAMNT_0013009119 /DNA_START=1 /DNA_END=1521 /DNA_ORIENTATION=-